MKQYNFKIECSNETFNGVKVSVKAEGEAEARAKVEASMKRATKELSVSALRFLGTGKLTPAQMLGAVGGTKSRRAITEAQQRAMQEARKSTKLRKGQNN